LHPDCLLGVLDPSCRTNTCARARGYPRQFVTLLDRPVVSHGGWQSTDASVEVKSSREWRLQIASARPSFAADVLRGNALACHFPAHAAQGKGQRVSHEQNPPISVCFAKATRAEALAKL
jgi:hypothetical protein